MTEMGFVMAGGLLVLVPAAMMMLYSNWNMKMAQKVIQDWQEQRHRLMEMERSVLESEGEIRLALRAQVAQLDALDKSVGHIFGQVMSQAANRTVLRKEKQIGEDLPPFPGATPPLTIRTVTQQEEIPMFANPPRQNSVFADPS